MLQRLRFLFLLSLVALFLPACMEGERSDDPTTEGSAESPTPTDPEPTPTSTPSPSARISNLHLWKDGCDAELWGRWLSGDDYALDVFQILTEAGETVASITYYDLTFRGGMEEVWRFFDANSFTASRYRARFLFSDGSEHEETVDLDAGFFAGPALLTPGTMLADGPMGGLAVYAASTIDASVQRVMVYDANRCRQHWKVFYSEPQLDAGGTTRLDIGGYFVAGTPLLVTVEGVDYGANYTYYTSFEITAP